MIREDEIWHLKRLNFFPSITEDQLKVLVPTVHIRRHSKGESIYLPGQSADTVYLIRDGHVRLTRITPEGRSIMLDIFSPGDIVGEMALAGQEQRSEVAEAMQDCTLWTVPKQALQAIVEQNAQMALQITKLIGFRRVQVENKISNLLCTVPVRLARLFLLLADRYPGMASSQKRYVNLRLTHQEMGELIAANREIVTATLNRFRKEATIDFLRNLVVLENEATLRDLAGEGYPNQ